MKKLALFAFGQFPTGHSLWTFVQSIFGRLFVLYEFSDELRYVAWAKRHKWKRNWSFFQRKSRCLYYLKGWVVILDPLFWDVTCKFHFRWAARVSRMAVERRDGKDGSGGGGSFNCPTRWSLFIDIWIYILISRRRREGEEPQSGRCLRHCCRYWKGEWSSDDDYDDDKVM